MNIFQIQQELLSIFDTIEENGGEITPEIEEQLAISQETFKDKIQSYANVIKQIDADLSLIKDEKDRLKKVEDSKKRTKERLSAIMCDAINMFGDTTKSGSKFVDYGTGKASIRRTTVCDTDDERAQTCVNGIVHLYKYWINNKSPEMIDLLEADNINHILENYHETINAENIKRGIDVGSPITVNTDDLDVIDMTVSIDMTASNAFSEEGKTLLKDLFKYGLVTVKAKVNKTVAKNTILEDGVDFSIAHLKENENLSIK